MRISAIIWGLPPLGPDKKLPRAKRDSVLIPVRRLALSAPLTGAVFFRGNICLFVSGLTLQIEWPKRPNQGHMLADMSQNMGAIVGVDALNIDDAFESHDMHS